MKNVWQYIRGIGLLVQSAKGWLAVLAISPSVVAFVLGFFEGRPWSDIVMITTITLAAGAVLVYYGMRAFQGASAYFTNRKEQSRIAQVLGEIRTSGITELDTATAAAIWAGTREDGDIIRHVRFRQIKALIAGGQIRNTRQADTSRGPNIHTRIPLDELEEYFRRQGIMPPRDR